MTTTPSVGEVFGKEEEYRTYASDDAWVLPSSMIGVEIELERCPINPVVTSKLWDVTEDNSLRVVDNIRPFEIIFRSPLCGKDLTTALNDLENGFATLKIKPLFSSRTSVHVHLDVRDLKLQQFLRLIIYYVAFESVLFRYAGAHRADNVFCLSLRKAEGRLFDRLSISSITNVLELHSLANKSLRYSALNFSALQKFGTVEFRHMEGTADVNRIKNWINILMCLKKTALEETKIPLKDIPGSFSYIGIEHYAKEIFGDYFNILNYPEFQLDVLQGIRQAQDILYRDNLEQVSTYLKNILYAINDPPVGIINFCKKNNIKISNIKNTDQFRLYNDEVNF